MLASFIKLINLPEKERKYIIECALAEKELAEKDEKEEDKNKYARKFIEYRFTSYTNAYLRLFLSNHLRAVFEIKGKRKTLYICECCGYKVLTLPGEWDICKVCFWENDGSAKDESIISSSNRMTLGEAKKNFLDFGACYEGALRFLDKDRFLQFASDIEVPRTP